MPASRSQQFFKRIVFFYKIRFCDKVELGAFHRA